MGENSFLGVVLDSNKYYFLCSAGIGDTMLICGFINALQEKWKGKIHLLVKSSHAFLMDMYLIADYSVVNIMSLKGLDGICRQPQKGRVFVAHPHMHEELQNFFVPIFAQNSKTRFLPWFREFLGLALDCPLTLADHMPVMSDKLKERCEEIGPIDKIALLSPEATSMQLLPALFWESLARDLKEEGYYPVSNVIDPLNCISGTSFLKLSSGEAAALAVRCQGLYSLRSGLCDPLYEMGPKLHLYYPTHNAFFIYSMNAMFDRDDIDEHVILPDIY